jgi:hypothetical protein
MHAFDEASELRLRALGAMGGAMAAGGGKRRRMDGGRTFHQSIGIGNVGKKGGSDTPGGVQVSMVALCNYILSHGGWEKVGIVVASSAFDHCAVPCDAVLRSVEGGVRDSVAVA